MKLDFGELDTVELGEGDIEALQRLNDRCADFVEMLTGAPPRGREGEEMYWRLPPGKQPTDKILLGLRPPRGGELVGVIELIRDCRRPGDWCVALLLLDPAWRARGTGARLVAALFDAIRAAGGNVVCLVVQKQNPGALRFWTRMGLVTFREDGSERGMERSL